MPENPLCVYCGQAVDIVGGTEEYVIPNKERGVSKEQWAYAHLECYTSRPQDSQK